MLHSIYDLTTFCRPTTGDVPAKLVGASTTVVGSKMYLFGGRLVSERKMVSDLYCFDLHTFSWQKLIPHPDDDVPRARYFHSADTWNNQLIIFGGMSNRPDSVNADELCVLNDVRFFDLDTHRWIPEAPIPPPINDSLIPRARYAHLSSVTADRLFIIGGQDFFNTWLDDVCVYDLVGKAWVLRREYPRHCGTYRSVAVSSNLRVRLPQVEQRQAPQSSSLGPPGARFRSDGAPLPQSEYTSSESLLHLPYSSPPTEGHPSDIYLYSNYNFTDVKRELEVFSPLPDTDFTISDRSSAMTGSNFPPGLRFPTGAILGTHLIIAGTYLAHSFQSFSIWVLDLLTMTWSRIDPGKAVETGSWFRGSLWAEANKFLIFGNRQGNLVDDYNRRLLSWDHVAVVDLEAFGIYQPPPLKIDIPMQELGLAALEEKVFTDFDIITDDGRRISCSRNTLVQRWPWLREQLQLFTSKAQDTLRTLPSSSMHVPLPDLPGSGFADHRPDPRLTPRSFHLSEPYPITLALMQYFYSLALITPLQHAPAVLSQLLVLATNYKITHLESLVKHAMHRALSNSTSVGVYEVATLCSCRSLQIRALKTVMSYTQKRPGRSRGDQDGTGGSGGKPPDGGSGPGVPPNGASGGGSGGPASGPRVASRPRGTSDARWLNGQSGYSHSQTQRKVAPSSIDPAEPPLSENGISELRTMPVRRRLTSAALRHSIVSLATENEIQVVTDLLSSAVNTSHHTPDKQTDARPDSQIDLDLLPEVDIIDEIEELYTSHYYLPPEYSGYASSSDEYHEPTKQQVHAPAPNGFHLPRRPRSLSLGALTGSGDYSDTPSLISSSSSIPHSSPTSSVRTPSILSSVVNNALRSVPEDQPTSEWLMDDDDDEDTDSGYHFEDERVGTPSQKHFGGTPTIAEMHRPGIRIDSPTTTMSSMDSPRPSISSYRTMASSTMSLASSRASPHPQRHTPDSPRSYLPSSSSSSLSLSSQVNPPLSPHKSTLSFSQLLSPSKSKSMPMMQSSKLGMTSILPLETKTSRAEEKRRKKEQAKEAKNWERKHQKTWGSSGSIGSLSSSSSRSQLRPSASGLFHNAMPANGAPF